MDDESSDEYSDTHFLDSFIDGDELEDGLTWDSEDSRPAGPSPPSRASMNDVDHRTTVRIPANVFRRMTRSRTMHTEDETDSVESDIVDVETIQESDVSNHSVSTIMIHDDQESMMGSVESDTSSDQHSDTDETRMSTDSDTAELEPHSPSQSPPDSPNSSMSNTPEPPEPDMWNYMGPNDIVDSPASPDYPPPEDSNQSVEDIAPHSPEYPPPEPDVEVIEGPQVEVPADVPEVPELRNRVLTVPPLNTQASNDTEPPKSKKRVLPLTTTNVLNSSVYSESDEGTLCAICMDPLTNSGKHRVVCLRCGHIFGHSCIERWIKVGCNNGAKRCPTCNKKACLKDIRVLYLPKVVPLDTVERDKLVQEKEELSMQKNLIDMELSRCKLQNELNFKKYEVKIQKLEKDLQEAVNAIELLNQGKKITPPNFNVNKDGLKADLLHMVEISKDAGCRVLAFNPLLQQLVVSQPSGNTIFAGFGVRILNSVDFAPTRFVYLHQKMIRDLCFHAEDKDLLLSVSLDQTAKLVDLASSITVHTFKGEGPLWCCSWDMSNPHLLMVGSQLGKVSQYDRRMMDCYLNQWENKGNTTPIVALASTPSVAQTPFPQGGFLSCRLNSTFAYARHGQDYACQELMLDGPFMAMRYDYTTQTLLTASRPSSRNPYTRINLNLLDADNKGNITLPSIHSFNCGSSARVMSRMTTLPVLNDSLVVAHHESGRTVNLWSSKSGDLVHSLPIKEPVIDLTTMNLNNSQYCFAALSEKKVGIYKVC